MAQILNSQAPSQAVTSSSANNLEVAISKLNGQLAVLQSTPSGAAQLSLNGISIVLPKLLSITHNPQTVQLKIREQATQTLLDIVKPGKTPQSLQLTPSQSQQLLSSVGASPELLSQTSTPNVEGKVKHIVGNQVTLQVGNKAFTLTINNAAQHFKVGQTIELKLSAHADKWKVDIPAASSQQGQTVSGNINAKQLPTVLASTLPKHTQIPLQVNDKAAQFALQKALPNSVQGAFSNQLATPTITIDKQLQVKLQWTQIDPSIAKIPLEGQFKGKVGELAGFATTNAPSQGNTAVKESLSPSLKGSAQDISAVNKTSNVNVVPGIVPEEAAPNQRVQLDATQAKQLTNDIQPLLRALQARIESPSLLINRIEIALNSLKLEPNSPIEKLVGQLTQAMDIAPESKGKVEVSAQEVKQIFNSATVPLTPSTVSSPPQNQSQLLSGLIGMMQVSLAARLANKGNAQLEKVTQLFTPPVVPGQTRPINKQQVSKGLSDFMQMDSKFQLLKGLDKLLSSHQYNKLSSLEAQLQGQDSMYYVLPFGGNEKRNDVEVLIKREQGNDKDKEKAKQAGNYWVLSMKLPVGDIGQVLAKAKINGKNLDLDFYTSNTETRDLVFNFIPVLKKRFDEIGIDVDKCFCQLGKIPESLQERPYQLFEAKA